jgi:hypothetical protein
VTGLAWEPGTELWLRWSDSQLAALSDDGLAIDNVRFTATAIPEPTSAMMCCSAVAALLFRRRRYFLD